VTAPEVIEGEVSARGRRVAIVAARFNDLVVTSLLKGAVAAWQAHGGEPGDLVIVRVPGSFELPLAARKLAAGGRYQAVVALGCVIRGDTPHFEYVAGECARGLQQVNLDTGVPVAFGVLTVESLNQALERAASGAGNKGGEAMKSALEMAAVLERL
jgi:6,7-dimethyl-8-ribityllumazine synthase